MSTPMFDMPEHLAMAVTFDGQGPADGTPEAVRVLCWCGDPDCVKYGPADGGRYAPVTCARCKVTGVCRPDSDYYKTHLWPDGRVCETCFFTLAGLSEGVVVKAEDIE